MWISKYIDMWWTVGNISIPFPGSFPHKTARAPYPWLAKRQQYPAPFSEGNERNTGGVSEHGIDGIYIWYI